MILPGAGTHFEEVIPETLRPREMFDFRDGVTSAAPLVPPLWARLQPQRASLLDAVASASSEGTVALVGSAGSGKSVLAEVAASQLAADYPGGQAQLMFEARRGASGMASLIMRTLRIDVSGMQQWELVSAYQQLLKERPYLVVLDEADLELATELIPPAPSTAIFVSRRAPKNADPYRVFNLNSNALDGLHSDPRGQSLDTQPGYASDSSTGDDLLSIHASVNALCSVVAAKEVRPPLSIGLFGDWGAGKSFFLEKMRPISSLSTASAAADGDSAYVSSVRQIVFNAWHYADANLWASLAGRVFEGLREGDNGSIESLIAKLEKLPIAARRRHRPSVSGEQSPAARRG